LNAFTLLSLPYLNLARVGGFHILINFHEEPLGVIKLDASSREAGQDSGINFSQSLEDSVGCQRILFQFFSNGIGSCH
jgi:hypothetical protein